MENTKAELIQWLYKRPVSIIFTFLLMLNTLTVEAKRLNPERYYQNSWCSAHKGVSEYVLPDKARVDCLTEEYAIEFDFANKWAESIGQSLYYGFMTDRKPAIVLIMENPEKDMKYLKRLNVVADKFNIKVYTITK